MNSNYAKFHTTQWHLDPYSGSSGYRQTDKKEKKMFQNKYLKLTDFDQLQFNYEYTRQITTIKLVSNRTSLLLKKYNWVLSLVVILTVYDYEAWVGFNGVPESSRISVDDYDYKNC